MPNIRSRAVGVRNRQFVYSLAVTHISLIIRLISRSNPCSPIKYQRVSGTSGERRRRHLQVQHRAIFFAFCVWRMSRWPLGTVRVLTAFVCILAESLHSYPFWVTNCTSTAPQGEYVSTLASHHHPA
jgi:hypothetical protein